jgi:NTE family protein
MAIPALRADRRVASPTLDRRAFAAWLGAAVAGCGGGGDVLPPLAPADEPRRAGAPQPAALALVLSGGGLRGFAHLGVMQGLESLGIVPDLVVGTSVGAIVGGVVASGRTPAALAAVVLAAELDPFGSWLVAPSTRGVRLQALLAQQLACRCIEDFPLRFAAVAAERASGCLAAFGAGDAARAILASAALPGALAPVRFGGTDWVDGSIGTPLPVRIARALGARHVIAVDVSFHPERPAPAGIVDSVFHAGMLMTRHLAAADRAAADLVIDPALPPVPEVTLANAARLVACGARAVADAAPRLRALATRVRDAAAAGVPPPLSCTPPAGAADES